MIFKAFILCFLEIFLENLSFSVVFEAVHVLSNFLSKTRLFRIYVQNVKYIFVMLYFLEMLINFIIKPCTLVATISSLPLISLVVISIKYNTLGGYGSLSYA